jgi:DNA repair protein RecO (recombination protein O)
MPARVSESFVLRTYPFREADLVVSFFTRDLGKLRGIARRARRPKSPFGSGLERLSQVRMAYFQKENAELASLSGCELIESQFALQSDYASSMALDYFTEVTEQLLPPHEPNERFFRLLAAALAYLRSAGDADRSARMWTAVAYVSIWAVRLAGVWPEFRVSHESVEIAEEMFTTPITELAPREWTKATAADLRRLLVRTMEQHAERKFMTVPLLEAL